MLCLNLLEVHLFPDTSLRISQWSLKPRLWSQIPWVQIPALLLIHCLTVAKLLNFSKIRSRGSWQADQGLAGHGVVIHVQQERTEAMVQGLLCPLISQMGVGIEIIPFSFHYFIQGCLTWATFGGGPDSSQRTWAYAWWRHVWDTYFNYPW